MMFSIGWLSTFDLPVYFLLGASFVICACICYPVGQLCGKLLHSSNSLNAYGLNLGGSILGVIALFVMSLYWLPPVIWFAVTGGMLLLFVLSRDNFLSVGIASFCVLLGILAWPVQPETQRIYSPYQLLERTAKSDGLMMILSGGNYYQKVYNFADSKRGQESDADRYVRAYYEFPYNFKKVPERVAIVGSGSGNDVATALRMGAAHVDAIEIDPAIAFLGTKYHPERPYDDPRVTLSINDARNFFRTAEQQYDLIVYGVLDSHTALSHASNLRVDSYVYTREGIAEAYRLLKPEGDLDLVHPGQRCAGLQASKIIRELPGAGKPLAVRVRDDTRERPPSSSERASRDDAGPERLRVHRLHRRLRLFRATLSGIRGSDRRLAVLLHGRASLSGHLHDRARHGFFSAISSCARPSALPIRSTAATCRSSSSAPPSCWWRPRPSPSSGCILAGPGSLLPPQSCWCW